MLITAEDGDWNWRVIAKGMREHPLMLVVLVLLSMWLVGSYISRGLQVVIPIGLVVAVFGMIVWGVYKAVIFVTGQPAVVGGWIGIGLVVAVVLAVIGYVADEKGWFEFEDEHAKL